MAGPIMQQSVCLLASLSFWAVSEHAAEDEPGSFSSFPSFTQLGEDHQSAQFVLHFCGRIPLLALKLLVKTWPELILPKDL